MARYCAFLGNHPQLSLAELAMRFPDCAVKARFPKHAVVFETSAEISQKDLDALGGTILIAAEAEGFSSAEKLPDILVRETAAVKGKTTFAIRAIGLDKRVVHDGYRKGKDALKRAGKPARYVGNEHEPAAVALLKDAGLVTGKGGRELVMLWDSERGSFWGGTTVAAQDIDAYTKRDMKKPVRDTRVGLLPPKLAQMLLNGGEWLARSANPKTPRKPTVFDPFCGTGVVPLEALLRGWTVHASDASLKAVNGAQRNIDWARKEYGIPKKDVKSSIWKQDATKPFAIKEPVHFIATETTLGPPLVVRPTIKDAQKMRTAVEDVEMAFLKNVRATLPGVPVALTLPVWMVSSGPLVLERLWKELPDLGFEPKLPPGLNGDFPGRTSLLYRRGDAVVGREFVFLAQR